MTLPYCINCSKYLSKFKTHIETHHEVINGKDIRFNWLRAICPTCDSAVWFEAFEDISLQDYDKAIRRLSK